MLVIQIAKIENQRGEAMTGKLLQMEQAADRLNTPINTLRYWVVRGEAPASFLMGKRRMFREEAIEAFIAKKEREEQERIGA